MAVTQKMRNCNVQNFVNINRWYSLNQKSKIQHYYTNFYLLYKNNKQILSIYYQLPNKMKNCEEKITSRIGNYIIIKADHPVLEERFNNALRIQSSTKKLNIRNKQSHRNSMALTSRNYKFYDDKDSQSQKIMEELIDKLIKMILNKGKKINQYMTNNNLKSEVFIQNNIKNSKMIRIKLGIKLQALLSEGRISKYLKGINKTILEEIQDCIFQSLEKQKDHYLSKKEYKQRKQNLVNELQQYKQDLKKQLLQLTMPCKKQRCL